MKLNIDNLDSLALNLGPHTTYPNATIAVSLDYGEFLSFNVSQGHNVIPIEALFEGEIINKNSVVRINSQGWQNNRVNLESIEVNQVSIFKPSTLLHQYQICYK